MTKIIQRHDTAANWTNTNPTLAQGEFGVEDDTGKFKIGDGQTAWNSLTYFSMTDEFAAYREKYGAPSNSIPIVNTGNSITIKANVSIETPNGTLTNATDMTYTYDFLTDRILFATENDYYHAYAVYYGGKEPSPVGEQIFWFNNNVWTMISADGTKTIFNTQKITPIAKIYQVNGTVKNIDYSSYAKTSTGGGSTPSNMVTTDTAQEITGSKLFPNGLKVGGYAGISDNNGERFIYVDTNHNGWTIGCQNSGGWFSNVHIKRGASGDYINIDSGNISEYVPYTITKLTQSEYDALATKDENTMYIIVG